MTRRIISSRADADSDGSLTDVLDLVIARVQASLELDGDQPVDLSLLLDAAETATSVPKKSGAREAVMRYLTTLPEPQRTMFRQRRAGMSSRAIAESMGMDRKVVCRSMARMYVELKALVDR
jgi:DNA-directed RNA polymerase specialized sigma24 family protein